MGETSIIGIDLAKNSFQVSENLATFGIGSRKLIGWEEYGRTGTERGQTLARGEIGVSQSRQGFSFFISCR